MKKSASPNSIPQYKLENYAGIHRLKHVADDFGSNNLEDALKIPGFEIYSTQGMRDSIEPVKSMFYREGFVLSGTSHMSLGLEEFRHRHGTILFADINAILAMYSKSEDLFGYYLFLLLNSSSGSWHLAKASWISIPSFIPPTNIF
jgi:AraC family transcriptional activator of pobA